MSYLIDSVSAEVAAAANSSPARPPLQLNRTGAFLVHLGISALVFIVLGYLVVFVWYPDFFFATDGGWQGIRIIAAVDLVLGPALTLIVYRRGKPGLKMDLTMIGVFQAVCLLLGTYVVYSERPIAMVYTDGQFFSMGAGDYLGVGVEVPDLSEFPGAGPKWVALALPDDVHTQADIRREAFTSGRPLRTYDQYYVPFTPQRVDLEEAFPLEELEVGDRQTHALPRWLGTHGGKLEDYAFFRMGARYAYVFLGVHRDKPEVLGILETPAP